MMPDRGQILQELDRRGALPQQYRAEYDQLKAAGSIAPKGGFKAMPNDAANKLEEQVTAYAGLDRAVNSFKDDYSGPGSGIENTAQAVLDVGSPGQRDWWSDFRASDNAVRHTLFGASLTPGESAAYASTTITPNMAPEQIRTNLTRRRELAQQVLGRRAAFARSNGYMPEAVDAILGDYDPAKLAPVAHAATGNNGTITVGGFSDELPSQPLQQLKPEDRAAYFQLERRAKTPGELVGFMADRGFSMDPARARAIIQARDKGASLEGREIITEPPKPLDIGDGITGAVGRGVGDVATMGFLDEAGALVDTLAGGGGEGTFKDRLYRNIDTNRAIIAGDEQNHPVARFVGQLGGGIAVPFGSGARTAPALARTGAVMGGLYGLGSGEGNVLERVPNALAGAAAGGVGGYAFGRLAGPMGNALARFAPGPSAARQQADVLAQAAGRQNVPLTAADVRPGARNALAFLEASPGGNGPVRDALSTGNDALEAAVGRLGGGGTAGTPASIGDTVQGAATRAIDWSRTQKDRLYQRAEQLAGGTAIPSDRAVAALDQHIGELSQTPNANRGVLGLLQDLRQDLVDGAGNVRPLSIEAIRNLRTAMRGEIGTRNLTMTDAERRISDVIGAASDDITHGLIDAGRGEAAQAYRRADAFYRERQQTINDVLQRFLGRTDSPLSGEQTYARLSTMMGNKGDSGRLAQMMRLLTPDEQSDVAATIAGQLGRAAPDADFSPGRFVTMTQKLTPEARRTIFGNQGADAIGDLLEIASARRDTLASLNNSRSGQVSNYAHALSGIFSMLGAGGGYAAGGLGGAAAGAVAGGAMKTAGLNMSARLLTNQGFVRWLSRAPSATTPAQVEARLRDLSDLAVRQPAIRGEIMSLQRYLGETGVSRSIASERDEGDQQQGYRSQPAAAGR